MATKKNNMSSLLGCFFHGGKMEHKVFTQPKKRQSFNIMRENAIIEDLTPKLPEDESFVYITSGGFSSIAFIVWIAGQTRIKSLFASTLRVGVRQAQMLDGLRNDGRLDKVNLLVGGAMKDNCEHNRGYGYLEQITDIFNANGWTVNMYNNHSKVMLFDTDAGKFVIESSSNLNENPKVEQFRLEKSAELFDFYSSFFRGIRDEYKKII